MTAFDSELRQFVSLMSQLQAQPGLGSRALGVPEWDWRPWRMGREHLAAGILTRGGTAARDPREPPEPEARHNHLGDGQRVLAEQSFDTVLVIRTRISRGMSRGCSRLIPDARRAGPGWGSQIRACG